MHVFYEAPVDEANDLLTDFLSGIWMKITRGNSPDHRLPFVSLLLLTPDPAAKWYKKIKWLQIILFRPSLAL